MSPVRKSLFYRIDGVMIMLYVILVIIGLLAVFSVEHRSTDLTIFIANKNYSKQVIWFGYSLFLGFLILLTDSKFFASTAFLGYTVGVVVLILTIFIGVDVKGSHSWLGVGSFRFQPGEVCKIFTSLALAKFLSLPETNFKTLKHRLLGVALAMGPAVIILLQNEAGLALVYFCFLLVMYREGLPNAVLVLGFSLIALVLGTLLVDRKVFFIILTVLALITAYLMRSALRRRMEPRIILISIWAVCILFSQLAVPMVFKHGLKQHQIDRIYSMLGKEVPVEYNKNAEEGDEKKVNASEYNVLQSKIAIGSGGFTGKGFLNGTSTKNQFVPEQNTDFIFTAVAEQFGFLGSFFLIGIYVSLMLRIIFVAERQRSAFTRIYAYCVASILFFHFAINISMTIGLAPVIGITLPFLSYGGSSLLSFSILIFILVRLDADRQAMIR
ncbi:cell cycle protein [Flavipsychrobacter stenotrophus]|uniref:Cell wall polymerase n=1 Tax=Flavipsychrobacter stenotrophus TaxID=2077091 RepID=A0A2S7SUJ6_9BACT|nr:rod shape-determining protein RodA [Flavipsychrobacter stenotrophus]PQJ10291.1 cell cycle protein [Flavipsychrobacter stenotrophus]